MTTAGDIFEFINALAPVETQLSFDNAGFLVGSRQAEVSRVMLALDAYYDVIKEAEDAGCDMIVTHHPIIFNKLKSITDEDTIGRRLIELVRSNIAVVSMHTNLDAAVGGVNDVLISLLGAEDAKTYGEDKMLRIGTLKEPMFLEEYLPLCKKALDNKCLRYYNSGRPVYKIACLGGAGDGELQLAYDLGADTYVTSDIHYHVWLMAQELGINLIDADHFCTENPVMYSLRDRLADKFNDVEFIMSARQHQFVDFF